MGIDRARQVISGVSKDAVMGHLRHIEGEIILGLGKSVQKAFTL